MPLNRMEGLSDGVIAIAITLLVLELAVEPGSEAHLLRSIVDEWPSYLAYVTSFLTIESSGCSTPGSRAGCARPTRRSSA